MDQSRTKALLLAAVLLVVAVAMSGVAAAQQGGSKPSATDVGITDKEIRLAVMADVESPLAPGLFEGSVDAIRGWAKWVNSTGGLARRKVVVDFYDGKINAAESRNAVIAACTKDFASVGTSLVFLNNSADLTECEDANGVKTGLPDMPVIVTALDVACSATVFPINPPNTTCADRNNDPQSFQGSVGRAPSYYFKKYGKDLHGAYVYAGDSASAKQSSVASLAGLKEVGIEEDFNAAVSGRATQVEYAPIVARMRDADSNFVTTGGAYNQQVFLHREAKVQGYNGVKVWDCTLQCYDEGLLKEGGADVEGTYVTLLFLPFNEGKANKTLANFLKYVPTSKRRDGFAAQAWASAELFRQAANAIVKRDGENGLTRAALVKELGSIHSFNAGGMIGKFDVAAKKVTPCYALLQVKNNKFVRVQPKKVGTFNCNPKNIVTGELSSSG